MSNYDTHRNPSAKCRVFAWLGQSWSSCDECGRPLWEHTYEYGVGANAGKVQAIPPELAERVRRRYEGNA